MTLQDPRVWDSVAPGAAQYAQLRDDKLQLAARMRETHRRYDLNGDVASVSRIEPWIDGAEGRV